MKLLCFLVYLVFGINVYSQQKQAPATKKQPILDMHLHAMKANAQGPPPIGLCLPLTDWPVWDPQQSYSQQLTLFQNQKNCEVKINSPMTDEELLKRTLTVMRKYNIYGIISGSETQKWLKASPDRFIPGLGFNMVRDKISPDSVKNLFKQGTYKVFAEITNQYHGYDASDSLFDPYLKVAEELDIPVGIHIGPGPPGSPYLGFNKYRARLHSPLLLEESLIKHPGLRVYIMHAGWPMIDDLLAVLFTHPQVYVDIGVISFALPRKEFHRYLQRIVEAGFGKRVMFGSDQMVWPEAIEYAIGSVETANFLSPIQKRDIFYNNAARFLRLTESDRTNHLENK